MFERFIFAKLSDPETRGDVAARLRSALADLPAPSAARVGLPSDAASLRSWDVSLVVRGESEEGLAAALDGALFTGCLAELDGASECVKAWSFES